MRFPVVIHNESSGYGVTAPTLPGCFSAGDTIEEAILSGHEANRLPPGELLMDEEPSRSGSRWRHIRSTLNARTGSGR